MLPTALINRFGEVVPFDRNRIAEAINRAQQATGSDDPVLADELASVVVEHLERIGEGATPDIERVQDAVLYVLRESGNYDVALAYARYRDARERSRRERALSSGESSERLNLMIIARDGRQRPWSRELLERSLRERFEVSHKLASDLRRDIEQSLAQSDITEVPSHLVLSLMEASLVRQGMGQLAVQRCALRVEHDTIAEMLESAPDAPEGIACHCGRALLRNYFLVDRLPDALRQLYMSGRLWIDGLDDPQRGSDFTAALDGQANPWQIIAEANSLATTAHEDWNRVSVILPPIILGTLEQGQAVQTRLPEDEDADDGHYDRQERSHQALIQALESLSVHASIYLYCDGRTPLLEKWPFRSRRISLATYAQDFLILRCLQELGLDHISGPTLMKGGYRRRTAVAMAVNAQGLDEQFSQLDHLATGLVSAARLRLAQLTRPALAGADIRYAIYGLPPGSSSCEYLERQVTQEGLRSGVALSRTSSLPAEACQHLSRLFAEAV